MDGLVGLVRQFCTEYLGPPRLAVAPKLFDPAYCLHVGGHTLDGLESAYLPVARRLFEDNPDFGIAVHELFTDGRRLALRFSSHASSISRGGHRAVWGGVILFSSNGHRLTEAWLEEDFYGRQRQLESGVPDILPPTLSDPWAVTPLPADERAEAAFRRWSTVADMTGVSATVDGRSGSQPSEQPLLDRFTVRLNALCAINRRVAFHLTQVGTYLGGLPGCEDGTGSTAQRNIAGIAELDGDEVVRVRAFSDRLDLSRRLLGGRRRSGLDGAVPGSNARTSSSM